MRSLQRKQLVSRAARIRLSFKRTNAADLARFLIPFLRVYVFGNVEKHFVRGNAGVDAGSPPRRIEARGMAMRKHALSLFASACARLFSKASTHQTTRSGKRPKQGSILEPIPCSGGHVSVEWHGPVCSESWLRYRNARVASGIFAVLKDHRDKFIGDRCRQSEKERLIHRAFLPYAPRLKRVLFTNGSSLRLNLRDVRYCFYLFRLTKNASRGKSSDPECPKVGSMTLTMSPRSWTPVSALA